MSETTKRKKVKGAKKAKEESAAEEAAEVTRPGGEEKGVEGEPREEVEESREPAAEIPQVEIAPKERPLLKYTILTQCMKVPSFRKRVIYYLVKKLR